MTDTKIDDGGPAFPRLPLHPENITQGVPDFGSYGMSLRAWFAGLAMQGLLARGNRNVADEALAEADILIAALKEKKP